MLQQYPPNLSLLGCMYLKLLMISLRSFKIQSSLLNNQSFFLNAFAFHIFFKKPFCTPRVSTHFLTCFYNTYV